MIKEKKILIIGPKSKYNKAILEKYLKFKEVRFSEQKDLQKNIRNNIDILNTFLDTHEIDEKKLDLIQFLTLVNKIWKKKNKHNFFEYSKNEIQKAKFFFNNLGINLNKNWYVLLHVRSSEDNFSHRNSDVIKYKKAIEFIGSKGGYVIRIGDRSMKKLKETKNLIDLTDDPKHSEYLLFLYHNAKFFMTGVSGPGFMTTLFKNPCLHVDIGPIYEVVGKENDYCLPRMFFKRGKILNLNIRIKSELGKKSVSKLFKRIIN